MGGKKGDLFWASHETRRVDAAYNATGSTSPVSLRGEEKRTADDSTGDNQPADEIQYKQFENTNLLSDFLNTKPHFLMLLEGMPDNCVSFVASTANEPIGVILGQNEKDPKELYIDIIMVDQRFRNRGIGSQLIKYIEGVAKVKNVEFLCLEVSIENQDAQRLYGRHGFEIEDEEGNMIKMVKLLKLN